MPGKTRFTSFSVIIPVEFDSLFSGLQKEDPVAVLRMMSRDSVVKLASLLKRDYCEQTALKMAYLLSSSDPHFIPLHYNLKSHIEQTKQEKGADVVVAFDNTPLELLRIALSIQPDEMNEVSPIRTDELHWRLIKLIAQINQSLMTFTATASQKNDIAKLLLVNDASYRDIQNTDTKGPFIIQPTQAILFFQLLESKTKYTDLLKAFYEWYGISSWKEYVRTIYSLSLRCYKEGTGIYPLDTVKKNSEFLSQSVMDRISIDVSKEVIPYACVDEYDDEGNSDYRVFKGKPLFKLSNGDYVIHNQALLIDRLFQGLFFDFQHIASIMSENQPDIANLFTSAFVEKTPMQEIKKLYILLKINTLMF